MSAITTKNDTAPLASPDGQRVSLNDDELLIQRGRAGGEGGAQSGSAWIPCRGNDDQLRSRRVGDEGPVDLPLDRLRRARPPHSRTESSPARTASRQRQGAAKSRRHRTRPCAASDGEGRRYRRTRTAPARTARHRSPRSTTERRSAWASVVQRCAEASVRSTLSCEMVSLIATSTGPCTTSGDRSYSGVAEGASVQLVTRGRGGAIENVSPPRAGLPQEGKAARGTNRYDVTASETSSEDCAMAFWSSS